MTTDMRYWGAVSDNSTEVIRKGTSAFHTREPVLKAALSGPQGLASNTESISQEYPTRSWLGRKQLHAIPLSSERQKCPGRLDIPQEGNLQDLDCNEG